MFVEREASVGEPTSQERRDAEQNDKRILGHVVQCDGARATIAAYADDVEGAVTGLWTVGKMISINLGDDRAPSAWSTRSASRTAPGAMRARTPSRSASS